jgi:hypothetical protein
MTFCVNHTSNKARVSIYFAVNKGKGPVLVVFKCIQNFQLSNWLVTVAFLTRRSCFINYQFENIHSNGMSVFVHSKMCMVFKKSRDTQEH